MGLRLEIGAPAMRIILGWNGLQSGRRVVRTNGCRRATDLYDDNRKKKEPFKSFEIHVPIKEKSRLKRKRYSVTF
jgi:hypothetical protein